MNEEPGIAVLPHCDWIKVDDGGKTEFYNDDDKKKVFNEDQSSLVAVSVSG